MNDDERLYRAFAESIAPRRDLWPATDARIRRRRTRILQWSSAIAASLACVIAIAVLVKRASAPPPIPNAAVQRAEKAYVDAFALLNAERKNTRAPIDPKAIAQVDASIAEARAAVVAAPHDPRAVTRWRDAWDRKVELLRKAVESRS